MPRILFVLAITALAACGGSDNTADQAPNPTAAPVATSTSQPEVATTPALPPTPEPTATAAPTVTPVPTATPTPAPLQVISAECAEIQVEVGVGLPKASDFCSYEMVLGEFPTLASSTDCQEFLEQEGPSIADRLKSAWPYPIDGDRLTWVPKNCDTGFPLVRTEVHDRDFMLELPEQRLEPEVIADLDGINSDSTALEVLADVSWTNPLYPDALTVTDLSADDVGAYFCVMGLNWRNQVEREVVIERVRLKSLGVGPGDGIFQQIYIEWDREKGAFADPLDSPADYGMLPLSQFRQRITDWRAVFADGNCPADSVSTIEATSAYDPT